MLIKLFKYDFKAIGRLLAPIMLAVLALSTFIGFSLRSQYSASQIAKITIILCMILMLLIFLVFFLTFFLTVSRFRHSLFGNEGYLSFALPASSAEHIASKYLASMVWSILDIAIALLSFYVIFTLSIPSLERHLGIEAVRRFLDQFDFEVFDWQIISLFLVTLTEGIFHLYLAVSIGHLWSGHPVLGGILSYVGLALLRSRIYSLFFPPFEMGTPAMLFALVVSLIYAGVTGYILERHLNLE